jgi:arylsulfatase A-like enzyme
VGDYFPNDRHMAARALDDFMFQKGSSSASVLFGTLYRALYYRASSLLDNTGYPRGISENANYPYYFRLENLFGGLASLIADFSPPTFAYLHLFPPHAPYRSSEKFFGTFVDGWNPVEKPIHRFGDKLSKQIIKTARRGYDEYIATIDWEFGKLLDNLEKNGTLDNSYLIITADHGEMFERGEKEHASVLLYDPIMHIPLIVSAPGQQKRSDVYTHTHAVDLLPTIAQIAGRPIPSWGQGKLLPKLGGLEDQSRSIYTIEAKLNPAFAPLHRATIALQKDDYKLIYYTGYESEDSFELYNLTEDIEELDDLYPIKPAAAKTLKEELLDSLSDADKPYKK